MKKVFRYSLIAIVIVLLSSCNKGKKISVFGNGSVFSDEYMQLPKGYKFVNSNLSNDNDTIVVTLTFAKTTK